MAEKPADVRCKIPVFLFWKVHSVGGMAVVLRNASSFFPFLFTGYPQVFHRC